MLLVSQRLLAMARSAVICEESFPSARRIFSTLKRVCLFVISAGHLAEPGPVGNFHLGHCDHCQK
jgi:hypothetical protein